MNRPAIILPDQDARKEIDKFRKRFPGAGGIGRVAKNAIIAGLPKLAEAEKVKKSMIGGK